MRTIYTHPTMDYENFTNTILGQICFPSEEEQARAAPVPRHGTGCAMTPYRGTGQALFWQVKVGRVDKYRRSLEQIANVNRHGDVLAFLASLPKNNMENPLE